MMSLLGTYLQKRVTVPRVMYPELDDQRSPLENAEGG